MKKEFSFDLREDKGNAWIAFSIIFAGLLIAAAVIFTNNDKGTTALNNPSENDYTGQSAQVAGDPNASNMPEVTEADYMVGNINNPIKIVEYSDTECPFCKRLHDTLREVTKEFPNEVVWVYRHLPIVRSHPKALNQSMAVECAADQQGNDGYWGMLDRIYDNTPGNNRFDLNNLQVFANEMNLNIDEFNNCIDSEKFGDKIAKQINDGFAAGAQGTPYSVIITPEGNRVPVSGAQPIEYWRSLINEIIEKEVNQ